MFQYNEHQYREVKQEKEKRLHLVVEQIVDTVKDGHHNIRINAICPFFSLTNRVKDIADEKMQNKKEFRHTYETSR